MDASARLALPPTGPRAEKQSFTLQNNRFVPTKYIVDPNVLDEVALLYPETDVPTFLEYYGEEGWNAEFEKAFRKAAFDMDRKTCPGALWEAYPNNGIALSLAYDEVLEKTKLLVELILTENLYGSFHGPSIFNKTGVAYKVFIKGEPHERKKLSEGRQRIIFASPLHMTLAERMFFGPQNASEIRSWDTIPSKPGMPMNKEGAHRLKDHVSGFPGQLVSTDQSGWDWHVQEWLMKADIDVRYRLIKGSERARSLWWRGAMGLNTIAARKTVMFSDGSLYSWNPSVFSQDQGGMFPSGSYRTSSSNSRMRVIVRRLISGDTNCVTMGDDAVETEVYDFVRCLNMIELYAEAGFVLKPFDQVNAKNFEFCSKVFQDGKVYPVDTSVQKMLLNLARHNNREAAFSIAQELKDHPDAESLLSLKVFDVVRCDLVEGLEEDENSPTLNFD